MMHVWIVTSRFPFEPGEQFLETEIKYWAMERQISVTLLPILSGDAVRALPQEIAADLCLSRRNRHLSRSVRAIQAIFSRRLWRELFWLHKKQMLRASTFVSAWRTQAMILLICASLRKKIVKTKKPIIAYSYWFDVGAYALAALRREGLIDYAVTRAHRFDLYEERRTDNYMPFKRQFMRDLDKIFAVSEQGRKYLYERFGVPTDMLASGPLGVQVQGELSHCSSKDTYKIISVSFCVAVKRIDRIIEGIALASQKSSRGLLISWTHIGDGELRNLMEAKAEQILGPLSNVCFQFLGHLSNAAVLNYYNTNQIDVFINTSESEGLPVSIMEAMSYGIPAIAPAVGGIAELVNQGNGWLLAAQPDVDEIAAALSVVSHYKSERTRQAARQTISENYNSETNYRAFIDVVVGKVKGYGKPSTSAK